VIFCLRLLPWCAAPLDDQKATGDAPPPRRPPGQPRHRPGAAAPPIVQACPWSEPFGHRSLRFLLVLGFLSPPAALPVARRHPCIFRPYLIDRLAFGAGGRPGTLADHPPVHIVPASPCPSGLISPLFCRKRDHPVGHLISTRADLRSLALHPACRRAPAVTLLDRRRGDRGPACGLSATVPPTSGPGVALMFGTRWLTIAVRLRLLHHRFPAASPRRLARRYRVSSAPALTSRLVGCRCCFGVLSAIIPICRIVRESRAALAPCAGFDRQYAAYAAQHPSRTAAYGASTAWPHARRGDSWHAAA